jgi:glycerol-3-phosphate dehydrogenase (NAD(P)+)
MNILVLGAGTFGTAIAHQLARNNNNSVFLFSRNKRKVDEINIFHTNTDCFPNKKIGLKLNATNKKSDIKAADIIFIALPSSVIVENMIHIKSLLQKDVLIVNLSKGLLSGGVTVVDKLKEALKTDNIVTLKGPSFAVELLENSDTLLTLGYNTNQQLELIQSVIEYTSLHIDATKDIRGVEILSVLKNIYALIIGVVDAQYDSANTRFMILTKSFSEIRILLELLGGDQDTLFLACGFGDLGLTSLNDLSRNRTLGLLIGKGFFNADYKSNVVVLEGLNSIRMFYETVGNKNIKELPLFNKLYKFFMHKEKKLEFKFDDLN